MRGSSAAIYAVMSGSSGIQYQVAANEPAGATNFFRCGSSFQDRIVDQPRRPDIRGHCKQRPGRGDFDRLERRPVNQLDIVDPPFGPRAEGSDAKALRVSAKTPRAATIIRPRRSPPATSDSTLRTARLSVSACVRSAWLR